MDQKRLRESEPGYCGCYRAGARDRVIADLTNPNFFGGDKYKKTLGI